MKKYAWIMALLLALSLAFVFIGCGGDKDDNEEGEKGWTHNLGPQTLDLLDNFQYGKGYQGVFDDTKLFAGEQVKEGDVYNLRITFTASRDLKDILYVGLVDTTEAADYWQELTWEGDPVKPAPINGAADDKIILKDEVVSDTITMTAIVSATAKSAKANSLMFATDSPDGTEGTANSGSLGKITLTFTEFIFAKGDIDEGAEPEPEVALELKKTILDDAADWDYVATDPEPNPNGLTLKGNLKPALSTEILGYTGGEVRLFWVYAGEESTGIGNNWGIGSFGGVSYNAVPGGMSGTAVIPINDEIKLGGSNNNAIVVNPYNKCPVIKIEIWGPAE